MRTIWKYPLHPDQQALSVPKGHRVLSVGKEPSETIDDLHTWGVERPVMWILVDPKSEKRPLLVVTVGTGHAIDDTIVSHVFVGTVRFDQTGLVLHVFAEST